MMLWHEPSGLRCKLHRWLTEYLAAFDLYGLSHDHHFHFHKHAFYSDVVILMEVEGGAHH